MIGFYRRIRKKLADDNQFLKYSRYAIGEIVLVMVGILLALQVNNWNELQKNKNDERYILTEILNNLNEDSKILNEILIHRKRAQEATEAMLHYVPSRITDKQRFFSDLAYFYSFDRYFPINNAYEMLKSRGLKLSNRDLTTKLSRYYYFEQNRIRTSIQDIENAFNEINFKPVSLTRFFIYIQLNEKVMVEDVDNPIFKNELMTYLISFRDNNGGTLNKLQNFIELHNDLIEDIKNEIN